MHLLWWLILGEIISIPIACLITYYICFLRIRKSRWRGQSDSTSRARDNNISILTRKLAHEIRNPLNGMDSNLQLLIEDLETASHTACNPTRVEIPLLKDKLNRVRREIERLEHILKNFLRYANLPPLKFELCDMGLLLEEELNFIEPEAQRQNIMIVRNLEPLPEMWVDSDQLKQALLNLIINANQAMTEGGTLTITARRVDDQVRIDVTDTGCGIPPERQGKIFDIFYSTKEEGTGIGLAIVKQIIEGHGGNITVSSENGKVEYPDEDGGATFSIFLPIRLDGRH